MTADLKMLEKLEAPNCFLSAIFHNSLLVQHDSKSRSEISHEELKRMRSFPSLNPPRRVKSLNSIQARQTSALDRPENSYLQAQTAAELAFQRARGRAGLPSEPKPLRASLDTTSSNSKPGVARMQSIRFAGPNANKYNGVSITRTEVSSNSDPPEMIQNHEFGYTHPSRMETSNSHSAATEYVELNIASQPSSYRKLRKAKSMFGTKGGFATNSEPGSRLSRRSMQSSGSFDRPIPLGDRRLKRSFSFLRGVADRLPTRDEQNQRNDAAIKIARDQYLHQIEHQRTADIPRTWNKGKQTRLPKPFRRTVRSGQANDYDTTMHSSFWSKSSPQGFGGKARSASHTLRKVIKRVFGRSSTDVDGLPAQHLSATRPHYGDFDSADGYSYPPIPSPDVSILRHVHSHDSLSQSPRGSMRSESAPRTLRSMASEEEIGNTESRITSWTDSTIANTVSMMPLAERKRLSVIAEDGGPYQPSTSSHFMQEHSPSYVAFRQPANFDHNDPVAARRVFSALQREIRKTKSDEGLEEGTMSKIANQNIAPSKYRPISIRKVASCLTDANGQSEQRRRHRIQSLSTESKMDRTIESDFKEKLTPQDIAHLKEPIPPMVKAPLQETGGGFFPHDYRIDRLQASPYKTARRGQGSDESRAQKNAKIHNHQNDSGIEMKAADAAHKGSTTFSGSIYSCSSGQNSPRDSDNSLSTAEVSSDEEAGTATIITRREPAENEPSQPQNLQQRNASGESSGEWKRWMASEVSLFEDNGRMNDGIYNAFPLYRSGHKRESAQIDEDDVAIGNASKSRNSVLQPLGLIQANTLPNKPLQQSRAGMYPGRLHGLSFEPSSHQDHDHGKENLPAQASRGQQETAQKENHGRGFTARLADNQNLSNSKSLPSLQVQGDENKGGVQSRHDPRRMDRLRRLYSSSSLSLNQVTNSPNSISYLQGKSASTSPTGMPMEDSKPRNSSMTNGFLGQRRRELRISEESGSDPAFL